MLKEDLDNYIKRMSDIRSLSSPEINDVDNAGVYSERLRDNFRTIGLLAAENRKTLDEVIFPLAYSDEPLTDEEIELIRDFNDGLVDTMSVENLDTAIMSLLSDRLMKDAESKNDDTYLIKELQNQVIVCHAFTYMTSRICTNQSICEHFRQRGLTAARRLTEYLKPELFDRISNEARDAVLMIKRFMATLYGSASGINREDITKWIDILNNAMDVFNDPYYHQAYPDFDWDYYIFRTHEYYGSILDYTYRMKLSDDQLSLIKEHVTSQEALWQTDPEKYDDYSNHPMIMISLLQAKYLTNEIDVRTYREELNKLYAKRDRKLYDFDNLFVNIRCVLDTIISIDPTHITESDKNLLAQYYNDLTNYVFHMPNGDTLSELLELYTPVLENFIEIPGKISFKEMCLRSLAAMHPPTYVHSRMVALLSHCMCSHLIETDPKQFIGMMGCESIRDVVEKKADILNYTFNAALCHDFGKLPIIDTIFIYGRKLLDMEFDIIKQHPDLGMALMENHESTRQYVDVARGHHRWYDNSKGYPDSFDTSTSEYKTIIDIVACADCMDAATDSIGRSYNQGKKLADFEKELAEGAGTRYAPFLTDLIARPEVREDIEYLLSEGRNINYRNTYLLLSDVQRGAQ